MILSDDYLQGLLDEALTHMQVDPETAMALEGSIAEGFGNESSDIDFVILAQSERALSTMPTLLFVNGHRVEVRVRSVQDLAREAALLRAAAKDPSAISALSYNDLDRGQRLAGAYPLRCKGQVASMQQLVPNDELQSVISRWFASVSRESARCAVALGALGQRGEAINWAQTALEQAAKGWLASHGETYIGLKWISRQFSRVSDGSGVYERYTQLMSQPDDDTTTYLSECLDFVGELGVEDCQYEPERVSLALSRVVTTWPIGDRLHVVRSRSDVFVFEVDAAAAWRALSFAQPLTQAVERVPLAPDQAGDLIAAFHRFGLVKLRWNRRNEIRTRGVCSAPTTATAPLVSVAGAPARPDDVGVVRLLPVSATRFAAAGMALVWANVEVENSREDAEGALAGEQWSVLAAAVRRMTRKAAAIVLSAYGVIVLSDGGDESKGGVAGTSWQRREADEEACRRLTTIQGLPEAITSGLQALDENPTISSEGEARRLFADAEDMITRVRDLVGASAFPSSFGSAEGWRATVEIGYDWIRLGAFLDSTFPVDEAREVLAGAAG
jgi:hypothetical protein